MTRAIIFLEIQEGNTHISTKEHQSLGSTTACVIQGSQSTDNISSFLVIHEDKAATKLQHIFFEIVGFVV